MKTILVVLALVLFGGCATVPPECKTEYASTYMHCPPPPPRPPTPAECKKLGGVQIYEEGRYKGCMSQEALRRVFQSL